jgi:hypothetical protein
MPAAVSSLFAFFQFKGDLTSPLEDEISGEAHLSYCYHGSAFSVATS